MMIAIPPNCAVSQVTGYIKGKSATHLARVYRERKRNFVGQYFLARGFWGSTVSRDEAAIREYIRKRILGNKTVFNFQSLRTVFASGQKPAESYSKGTKKLGAAEWTVDGFLLKTGRMSAASVAAC